MGNNIDDDIIRKRVDALNKGRYFKIRKTYLLNYSTRIELSGDENAIEVIAINNNHSISTSTLRVSRLAAVVVVG